MGTVPTIHFLQRLLSVLTASRDFSWLVLVPSVAASRHTPGLSLFPEAVGPLQRKANRHRTDFCKHGRDENLRIRSISVVLSEAVDFGSFVSYKAAVISSCSLFPSIHVTI